MTSPIDRTPSCIEVVRNLRACQARPRRRLANIASPTGSNESLDLYVLAGERSREIVRRFHDRWLTGFVAAADDYEFPQWARRPDAVYGTPSALIDRLLAEPEQPHSLYWRNPNPGLVMHGMVFFTTDGALIAGLTVATEDPEIAGTTLRELALSIDARYGFAWGEAPPADTAAEFKREAETQAAQEASQQSCVALVP